MHLKEHSVVAIGAMFITSSPALLLLTIHNKADDIVEKHLEANHALLKAAIR
ncbi:MAG: hypothetical protein Q4A74_04090 [Cardiobacteriaceae bacterium]|nr:hypothetical protein [Cardiobacteriaceae bacterium]